MPIDITKNYLRVRQFSPKKCKKGSFRTIPLGHKGTLAVICRPKGSTKTKAQSILTPRRGKWAAAHSRLLDVMGYD